LTLRTPDGNPARWSNARNVYLDYVGRRKPGMTMEQVDAEVGLLASQLQLAAPPTLTYQASATRVWLKPAVIGLQALALMIIPIIVLAIACVNAGNLLLARATTQSADWLTRLALGATRWRLIRQVLVESVLLALAGGALGLLMAHSSTHAVQSLTSADVVIDLAVMLFALLAAVGTALIFSLGPAVTVTRTAVAHAPEAGVKIQLRFSAGSAYETGSAASSPGRSPPSNRVKAPTLR
jgi:hypothetical protein